MKSRTKTNLANAQIVRLVKEHFGDQKEVGEIKELKGGMFNSAYCIQSKSEGDNIILKVSVHPDTYTLSYEKDIMATEVAVYELVSKNTSIPVPRILGHNFSKRLIPSDYFFMTELKGVPMSDVIRKIRPENLNDIKRELGGYFAQMHKISGPYFGYRTEDPSRQYSTWREAFLGMFRMILADGEFLKVRLPYKRIEKALKANAGLLEVIQEPILVNYDLWPGNIFVKQDGNGYQIEGIVDFERAFWGDPFADFPPAFMLGEDLWKDSAFWDGYTAIAGIDRVVTEDDQVRMTMYKLYIWIIMAVEVYRYGFFMGKLQQKYATSRAMGYLKALETARG